MAACELLVWCFPLYMGPAVRCLYHQPMSMFMSYQGPHKPSKTWFSMDFLNKKNSCCMKIPLCLMGLRATGRGYNVSGSLELKGVDGDVPSEGTPKKGLARFGKCT